jgi:tetratricopeptide (TPR) repeat protein
MAIGAGRLLGPYAVEESIGSGAMGIVYRARHTVTGDAVAVKVLRTQAPHLLTSFRREVHILAGLRHPNIVRILDQGLSSGVPWFAMEIVDGTSLRSLLWPKSTQSRRETEDSQAARTLADTSGGAAPARRKNVPPPDPARLPIAEVVRLAIPICRGLAFLHGCGVVHRDLKPENILIRADGTPVLADFGLVFPFGGMGREILDLADAGSGTLAYMAPEQRFGRFVDARADLFSLGCVLYEALTGVFPFGPAGVHEVSPAPPLPSAMVAGIPAALDVVVTGLLKLSPQDRIGYADDVAALLESAVGTAERSPSPKPTTYLYRSGFVGRRETFAQLEYAIDRAVDGRGSKVFVTGASGAGKTRLVLEAAALASEKGMAVITGECLPLGTAEGGHRALSAPLHPVRRLLTGIADYCRNVDPAIAKKLLAGRARLLAPHERLLEDLAEQLQEEVPSPLPDDAARTRMLSALASLVLDYARERPLCFIIDDLQWADELSLDLLSSIAASDCANAPLLLLGTGRLEEMTPLLQQLFHEPGALYAELDRLDKQDVGQMVGGMLALRTPPAELVEFLYGVSGGNPFFLAEYLRTAIAEGRLERNVDGRWVLSDPRLTGVAIPTAISALIRRRLDGLSPKIKKIVGAAAVLGRGFDTELLAKTAELDVADILDAYGTLRQRQIFEDEQLGSLRFMHDQLRDAAYSAMAADECIHWHKRAAASIEERYSGRDIEPYLGSLGFHLAKAGAPERAAGYFGRAAELARRTYANGDAVKLYRLAIEQMDRAGRWETRAALHEAIGDLLLIAGDAQGARDSFQAALADSPEEASVGRGRRLRKCARTWERQHQHGRALDEFARAEEQLGDSALAEKHTDEWWHEWVQVQVDKTWDLYWLARVDELSALIDRVRPVVEQHGVASQRAQFFQALVHTVLRRERYARLDQAIDYGRKSLAAAEQCDDLRELALAQFFLAFPLLCDGQLEEAEPLFQSAIVSADRIGDATLQARFLSYCAVLYRRAGRVEPSRRMAERAATIAEQGRMLDYVGVSHACLAWAAWKVGEKAALNHHANVCLAAWAKLLPAYEYPLHWLVRMPLSAQLVVDGDLDEAIAHWKALLVPTQHLLPPPLRSAMEHAIGEYDSPPKKTAPPSASEVVELAREFAYL